MLCKRTTQMNSIFKFLLLWTCFVTFNPVDFMWWLVVWCPQNCPLSLKYKHIQIFLSPQIWPWESLSRVTRPDCRVVVTVAATMIQGVQLYQSLQNILVEDYYSIVMNNLKPLLGCKKNLKWEKFRNIIVEHWVKRTQAAMLTRIPWHHSSVFMWHLSNIFNNMFFLTICF